MSKIRIAIAAGAVALVLSLIGCGISSKPTDPADHTTAATRTPTAAPTTAVPTPPTSKPTDGTDPGTGGEKKISPEEVNAIGTATDYLDTQAFSRKGLINQLKYEGYSTKVATAAVDSLHTDWNTQAVGVAKDYLNSQHFSRSGLISQLEFDGFSHSQAVYGVSKAGL